MQALSTPLTPAFLAFLVECLASAISLYGWWEAQGAVCELHRFIALRTSSISARSLRDGTPR